jgi:hypothetical protein
VATKYMADRVGVISEVKPKSDFGDDLFSMIDLKDIVPVINPGPMAEYKIGPMPNPYKHPIKDGRGSFTIKVSVVDYDYYGSHFSYDCNSGFNIVIDKHQVDIVGCDLMSVLIHELGHIVAGVSGLPCNQAVFRISRPQDWSPPVVLKREEEAWDVADKLYDRAKSLSLEAYRRSTSIEEMAKTIEFGERL